MTVLDAYAVIAYFRAEPSAHEVAGLLAQPSVMSTANAAEVMDQLARIYGRHPDDVEADIALLSSIGMRLAPVTAQLGVLAGRLRTRHYHRERMAVSLSDCVAAATALSEQLPLATADPALAEVVRLEGGKVHPLPDSKGRLP
ncbi:PIN domain-containing protein [Nocardia sp. CS682]|uniref:PIN domain-containing protein n=1 Tax=Nocardia sp. CS682 TaxID=1047172 RepID=UPI00142FB912|nr:PIN domain-containing protein [Nocardia sp. CS682]